jgi:hypothetical protein
MRIQMPMNPLSNPNLGRSIRFANELLAGGRNFFEEVRVIPRFDLSQNKKTGVPVSGNDLVPLFAGNIDVIVKTYKPFWWFSKAVAMTKGGGVIYFNERKLPQKSFESLVSTLIHESVHLIDRDPKVMSFGHGNNYAKGKENTAPYKLQDIAERIAKAAAPTFV